MVDWDITLMGRKGDSGEVTSRQRIQESCACPPPTSPTSENPWDPALAPALGSYSGVMAGLVEKLCVGAWACLSQAANAR